MYLPAGRRLGVFIIHRKQWIAQGGNDVIAMILNFRKIFYEASVRRLGSIFCLYLFLGKKRRGIRSNRQNNLIKKGAEHTLKKGLRKIYHKEESISMK